MKSLNVGPLINRGGEGGRLFRKIKVGRVGMGSFQLNFLWKFPRNCIREYPASIFLKFHAKFCNLKITCGECW